MGGTHRAHRVAEVLERRKRRDQGVPLVGGELTGRLAEAFGARAVMAGCG